MTIRSDGSISFGRLACLAAAAFVLLPLAGAAGRPAARGQDQDRPVTQWTDADKEAFLRTAEIVALVDIDVGITQSKRATLVDGRTRHDAHVQTIDVFNAGVTDIPGQRSQIGFRDTYKFNIAGYRLDRLIQLHMVPVSVYRVVRRNEAAVTWWVDDVQMMESERYRDEIQPPDVARWNDQMFTARAFTELIYNTDPNQGNFLITGDWQLRLIDFTRAFRRNKTLRSPENLGPRLARSVYAGLRELSLERLTGTMEDLLTKQEIEGLLARRDLILEHFNRMIDARGEENVLYDEPGR